MDEETMSGSSDDEKEKFISIFGIFNILTHISILSFILSLYTLLLLIININGGRMLSEFVCQNR